MFPVRAFSWRSLVERVGCCWKAEFGLVCFYVSYSNLFLLITGEKQHKYIIIAAIVP